MVCSVVLHLALLHCYAYFYWTVVYAVRLTLGERERDTVKLLCPVWSAKVCLGLQTSDGISLISLPQHDGKCLVVFPASGQVDVCVQEITERRVYRGRGYILTKKEVIIIVKVQLL